MKIKKHRKRPSAASELGAVGGSARDGNKAQGLSKKKKAQGTEEPSLAWTEERRQRGPIYLGRRIGESVQRMSGRLQLPYTVPLKKKLIYVVHSFLKKYTVYTMS